MKKIIVIDDDPAIQDSLSMVFKRLHCEVVIYPDADAILAGEFEIPNLFIIDKQLPGMNGLDLCRYLKKQASTLHIPVVIVSANPAVSALASEAGADNFIEKPYTMDILKVLIGRYIT